MIKEDIDRIASEYFDDKESEHEMDEVFDLAKKALEKRKGVETTNGEIIEQLENAIDLIKQDGKDWLDDRDIPILEACIKSLIALDKIRAEIKDVAFDWQEIDGEHESFMVVDLNDALRIIDKYKVEREDES